MRAVRHTAVQFRIFEKQGGVRFRPRLVGINVYDLYIFIFGKTINRKMPERSRNK